MEEELKELFKELIDNKIETVKSIDSFIQKWRNEIDQPLMGTLRFNKAFLIEKNGEYEKALKLYVQLGLESINSSTKMNVLLGRVRCLETLGKFDEIESLKNEIELLKST